ncbi:MAG: DNA gyrase/topoisomerase IV subunit A [Paludibacteraceae bacterium]|nr:DNA gyrase/topoisomerase IV subunit A [Paludibacteraceae bacterium]
MEKELDAKEVESTLQETPQVSDQEETKPVSKTAYVVPDLKDEKIKHHLSGMFQNWFLDYASYVILDRAVPNLYDGLKPVQRRILHSMRRMDDGRYNKVANIVGHTMQFHPHGDASIGNALVQLGQKDLLIDCQGNWGNILTGDSAAAPRYIEARLSKFALEVVFSPKVTEWKLSYDGRNKEPIVLPVKFPLLLVQGVEGIAVGLQTKILPHNFNEVIDAAIAYLNGEEFELYPDFPTGGYIDVSRYRDGAMGSRVKLRAKISKVDNRTLCISEIPYGMTTDKLIESILKANDKGKIQIKKVDDNTAAQVEILVHLPAGRSTDKTIDALYAFTGCELSVAPNCCVIYQEKPHFLSVSDVLKFSTDNTLRLLKEELLIQKAELQESIFALSLERIFIEERIYKDKEFEDSKTMDEAVAHIDKRLEPFKPSLSREVEKDDILKLMEIKMARILRFSSNNADETMASLNARLKETKHNLAHITEYTINWFAHLKERYGAAYPRKTEVRIFDTIDAVKVVEATEKLYINREEGFIGTALKKDEFLFNCSDIDDIIIFYKDGKFKVVKVADKLYVGKNIIHVGIFKKNDQRTVYNAVYRNGKDGAFFMKRFAATGLTRDKEYDLTQGTPGSKIWYFSANPNGEAEVLRVLLRPKPRIKKTSFEMDFSEIAIKGRGAMGNILTKNDVHRIVLKHKGESTLGGRKVWFDFDVLRLNYDGRGELLGEFNPSDLILVVLKNGTWFTTNSDAGNHYPDNILRIEKFDANKIWTAALFDADQKFPYLKRFTFEATTKPQSYLGENTKSTLYLLTDTVYPRIEVTMGGADANQPSLTIDAESFIGLKSYKAKGKRITTFKVASIVELEPTRLPEEVVEEEPQTIDETVKNNDSQEITLF